MEEIKERFKKLKWDTITISILAIVLGIVCIVLPTSSGKALCYVFGGALIIMGGVLFAKYFSTDHLMGRYLLILAITMLVSGVFCIVYPVAVQSILTVLFGIYIVIDSANSLSDSMLCAKAKVKGWFVMFIIAILGIVLGIAVMFSTFDAVMIFAGVSLIIEGVKNIIITSIFSHKIKEAKKQLQEDYIIVE